MKKLVSSCLMLFLTCSHASAQSDASLTWDVTGIQGLEEITFDASFTTRFISTNGIVTFTNNVSLPITGTCFATNSGGAYCSFFVGGGSLVTLDLEPSLNGTIKEFDINLTQKESGRATLTSIE